MASCLAGLNVEPCLIDFRWLSHAVKSTATDLDCLPLRTDAEELKDDARCPCRLLSSARSTRLFVLAVSKTVKKLVITFALALGVLGCSNSDEVSDEHPGEATYDRYCRTCHHAGIADSPKFGDAEAWTSRIEKGRDVLLQTTIDGIPPGMPVKGLCLSCSEEDLANAIDYMILAVEEGREP